MGNVSPRKVVIEEPPDADVDVEVGSLDDGDGNAFLR
jgi:hypothetical protein